MREDAKHDIRIKPKSYKLELLRIRRVACLTTITK